MFFSSFNLLQSFNYTPYLFYKKRKTVHIRDQFFLYTDPVEVTRGKGWKCKWQITYLPMSCAISV